MNLPWQVVLTYKNAKIFFKNMSPDKRIHLEHFKLVNRAICFSHYFLNGSKHTAMSVIKGISPRQPNNPVSKKELPISLFATKLQLG